MKFIGLCCALVLIGGGGFAEEPDIVRYVQQGEAFAAQGQLEPAIAEYEKALAAGAGSAAFLNRLGVFYLQAQNLAQAHRTFHLSLREKPAQLPVLSRLGEVFLASGQLDSAIYYVEQARLLAPQASPVHSSLGFLYMQGGDLKRARAQLDTALHFDPENPEAHRYLGFYFTQMDSLEAAIEQYMEIVRLVPDHFEAYNNIAFLLAQQGSYARALEYYEQARERAVEPALIYSINARIEAVRAMMEGKMRARFILVNAQAEAQDLSQRIQSGEDFAELARQYSQAPNAQDGGDVDFFGPGELLPEFEEAVLQLEVGEVSGAVQIPVGFLIIQRLN